MTENSHFGGRRSETDQLVQWHGQFGDDYVDRNSFEDWKMEPGKKTFQRMIGDRTVDSILEIGSNIGLNLIYLTELLGQKVDFYAVEPNKKAFTALISEKKINLKKAWNCSAFDVPSEDASIDLVFTCGVLIHIAPEDLGRATDEIVRVAGKYVLCIEYFSNNPEKISYRGRKNLLFKRDFGAFYLERYPNLKWIDYGFLWEQEFKIFDNLNWWLFEKREC
jgi:pseudaminic acid biosynthesis-associated methylase